MHALRTMCSAPYVQRERRVADVADGESARQQPDVVEHDARRVLELDQLLQRRRLGDPVTIALRLVLL